VGTPLSATPWRLHELGFYYLRTGDTSKARAYLTRSLQLRKARGDRVASGVNESNLATIAMAGGNVAEALAHLRAASAKDPSRFLLSNLVNRAPGADSAWLNEMRGLYGEQFETSYRAVLDSIRAEVKAGAGRRSRPAARESLERVGAPHP
jgi:tetratricopeptide (TPR) repeat protein